VFENLLFWVRFFDSSFIYIQLVYFMLSGRDEGISKGILKNTIFTPTFKPPLGIGTLVIFFTLHVIGKFLPSRFRETVIKGRRQTQKPISL
jgi:hypothetical protein